MKPNFRNGLRQLGLALFLVSAPAHAGTAQFFGLSEVREPLTVTEAFPFSAAFIGPNVILARWNTRPGHYLYRDKFKFQLHNSSGAIYKVCWPAAKAKDDPYFGRLEVYQEPVEVRILLDHVPSTELVLSAHYQGCAADAGICYPLAQAEISLAPASFASAETAATACTS